MKCDRARQLLWPPEEPRLASSGVLEARRHVESCEACRDYLAQDAIILAALRRAREVRAPAGVRERIFDALAQERMATEAGTTRKRRWRLVAALSTAALLALVSVPSVVLFVTDSRSGPSLPAETEVATNAAFVEDFLRRAVQAEHIETSDPGEVAEFLARELGLQDPEPLTLARYDLAGAEICIVEGVRGAVVVYKQDGKALYHYLIPKAGGEATAPALASARPPEWSGIAEVPAVVTWATTEVQQALVSDMPPEELLSLAREVARQG